MSGRLRFLLAAVPLFTAPPWLHADATLRFAFHTSGVRGLGAEQGTELCRIQGLKERDDSTVSFTGKAAHFFTSRRRDHVVISRADQSRMFELDERRKTFREGPLSVDPAPPHAPVPSKVGPVPLSQDKPTHRLRKSEITVANIGKRKAINGFSATLSRAVLNVRIEELATGAVSDYAMRADFWMARPSGDLKKALGEQAAFEKAYRAAAQGREANEPPFHLHSVALLLGIGEGNVVRLLNRVWEKEKAFAGYPVAVDVEWRLKAIPGPVTPVGGSARGEGAVDAPVLSSYRELVDVERAPLDSQLFEVPAGFKKVR